MSSSTSEALPRRETPSSAGRSLLRVLDALSMPLLAIVTALILGALVIFVTSGQFSTVAQAYDGLFRGAFTKERGFSESLVATVPYILLSLGLAVGFKSGLFNIGVEGQFTIGSVCAAWAGQALHGLPAIIHLPLALLAGALGGAIWGAIPGYLKARTGAHEVINTIMLNYVAFRLTEFLVSGPLKDPVATAVQTSRVSSAAELWSLYSIPQRLQDPLNALGVALVFGFIAWAAARAILRARGEKQRAGLESAAAPAGTPASTPAGPSPAFVQRHTALLIGLACGIVTFFGLPALSHAWWPFTDQYDRLHIGLFLALLAAVAVWWLLWKTTLGFELRTSGANPNAARYAGVNITRNIVIAMAISGGLAGVAGTIEVLGVSACRCLPLFFSSGYGFDSIAIALLGRNNPLGIVLASFLFGAMRNGADLMELSSGVSKYVISVIQALVLLFVAAPAIVRWIYRLRAARRPEEEAPLTRGWGG